MRVLLLCAAAFALAACAGMTVAEDDAFLWLEDVHGAKALEWVKVENARTAQRLARTKASTNILR